jgi:hypothetical protein
MRKIANVTVVIDNCSVIDDNAGSERNTRPDDRVGRKETSVSYIR